MSSISFVREPKSLLTGTAALAILGPAEAFTAKTAPAGLAADLWELARRLAADAVPGDLGAVATTLADGPVERVWVGVLPDRGSRYNSPCRAEALRHCAAQVGTAGSKGVGFLLLLDDADHVLGAVNAIGRAKPSYDARSGSRSRAGALKVAVAVAGKAATVPATAKETALAARMAAQWVDTPPTELHPGAVVAEARKALRGVPHVKIKEIAGPKLLTAKLGAIHAVGRCAVEAPRLLVVTYDPPRAGKRLTALVGKGITYDTGGLHLKARGSMEGMKCDMGGAAAVLGAFTVLAKTKHKSRLALLLCLAENAIGPHAFKPDDILTMHSGKTVEINNTDAEGRLVLGDGVSYAARVLGADTILDAATLTGAQMIATGVLHAAAFSNDPELERHVVEAGRATGDLVHPLMFAPEFYQQEFKSPVADMRNSVKNRANAQASCAAQFIYAHIADTQARWCHVDLAGPAWRGERGTGYGVALLSEAVRRVTA